MAVATGTALLTAGLASAAATAGSAVAQMFSDDPSNGGRALQLPPELEAVQIEKYKQFLDQADQDIAQGRALLPHLQERISAMEDLAKAGTPDPSVIQRINDIDAQIAERFGRETAADIKAGLITDEAKQQTIDLQKQVRAELEAQGKYVDDKLAVDIQQAIRNRLSSGSTANVALDEIGKALVAEISRTGDVVPEKDPRVENQLREQEDALRARLRAQFGSDYENTTQGRRALRDFYQGSTETRFSVAQQLKTAAASTATARVQRLATLGSVATNLVQTTDAGLNASVQNALGVGQVANNRIQRLSGLNTVIQGNVQNAVAAGEPERQRQLLDIQRAQAAQASGNALRQTYATGLQAQGEVLKLQQIPMALQQQLLQARAGQLDAGARMGQFDFSRTSQEALKLGSTPFKSRKQLYPG